MLVIALWYIRFLLYCYTMGSRAIDTDEKKPSIFTKDPALEDSSISIRAEQQPEWSPAEEFTARTKYFQHSIARFIKF